jgi:hypothetical protein
VRVLKAPRRNGSNGIFREINAFSGMYILVGLGIPHTASAANEKNRKDRERSVLSGSESLIKCSGNPIREGNDELKIANAG